MKNLKKHITLLFFVCIAFSCSEETLVDEVVADTKRGLVLRTLTDSNSFDIFDTSGTWSVELEIQDQENGAFLSETRLYFTFIDNNPEPNDVSSTETLVNTYPASHFSGTGEFGLPTGTVSLSYAEALSTAGITVADILPGDQFFFRLEGELTDGRVFTNNANGTVSGGSFYTAPFQYTETLDDGIEFTFPFANDGINVADKTGINIAPNSDNFDYSVNIGIDDGNNGDLLETLNIYREFVDRSLEEGETSLSEPEELFETYDIASLTLDEGVRELLLTYTLDELYGPNLTIGDLGINDVFNLRYELVTADGRVITTTEPDTEYFVQINVLECTLLNADAPFPGEYTIAFNDSFGDGWDGASIDVSIDGSPIESFTIENGSSGSSVFVVPEGAASLTVTYVPGNFEEEHSYVIQDPNGNVAAADGPNPVPGTIGIAVCGGN